MKKNAEILPILKLYLGCDVLTDDGIATLCMVGTIGEIDDRAQILFEGKDRSVSFDYEIGDKLLLIPFHKITDQDAVDIAKIFRPNYYDWAVVERNHAHIILECKDYKMWLWFEDTDFISCEEKYEGEENIQAHGGETETTTCDNIIEIIDTLRERHYALPYKGEDLFEMELAIDKTLIKQ